MCGRRIERSGGPGGILHRPVFWLVLSVLVLPAAGIDPGGSRAPANLPSALTVEGGASGPSARAFAAAAYDAAAGYLVLYGGIASGVSLGDTWMFTNGRWTELYPSASPGRLSHAAIAYDPASSSILLFGGRTASGAASSATWSFHGGNWHAVAVSGHPSARVDASATYDARTKQLLLFGGRTAAGTPLSDTWSFASGAWTKLSLSTHPSARFAAGFAFDATDGYALLFGGDRNGSLAGDTWKFASGHWSALAETTGPSARAAAALVDDPSDSRVLLADGCGLICPLGDSWAFSGGLWTPLPYPATACPGARLAPAAAYDPKAGGVLLFGGLDCGGALAQTWLFSGGAWSEIGAVAVPPTLRISTSGGRSSLAPSFWGLGQQTDVGLGDLQADALDATPARYVVWPAGGQGDRYDARTNLLYDDDGSGTTPNESLASFARWCRSAGCHAILTVPGEIDSPSFAAWEVNYTERSLGFYPDYWEIGNEPARWRHFGTPWTEWTGRQSVNATPGTYATLVAHYLAAMHAVDPRAKILGLPGIGTGAHAETSWINATVLRNGPRLAGVAIHVYPAGHPNGGQESLAQFFASLGGNGSLAKRVPVDRAAIRAACPTCRGLALFVTESNSATVGSLPRSTSEWSFVTGFPEVTYVTALLVQAMTLNLTNLDLYALQEPYGGSLLSYATGGPQRLDRLYADLLDRTDPVVWPTVVVPTAVGLYAVAATNAGRTTMTLLLANTNASAALPLALADSGFWTGGPGGIWLWNSTSARPVHLEWRGDAPTRWSLPADSVALLVGSPCDGLRASVELGA